MRPAGPDASPPGAASHLGGSPSRWLRWSSCTPFRVRERQDRETLRRGGALGMEPHDRVADQSRLGDVVPVVLPHLLLVDAERHGARDGPVGADGARCAGRAGSGRRRARGSRARCSPRPRCCRSRRSPGSSSASRRGGWRRRSRWRPRPAPSHRAEAWRSPARSASSRTGVAGRWSPAGAHRGTEGNELAVALAEVALLQAHAHHAVAAE